MRMFPALVSSLVLAGAAVAAAPSLPAQSPAVQSQKPKVFGYQDPETGEFRPMLREVPDATATAPTTGTVQLTLNITVKSTFPTGTTRTIVCGSMLTGAVITTAARSVDYSESASRNATGSGTTYSCVVTIPYAWVIPSASSIAEASFTGAYTVEVLNATASAGPQLLRFSQGDYVSASSVPATGTTSKYTVNVTI